MTKVLQWPECIGLTVVTAAKKLSTLMNYAMCWAPITHKQNGTGQTIRYCLARRYVLQTTELRTLIFINREIISPLGLRP